MLKAHLTTHTHARTHTHFLHINIRIMFCRIVTWLWHSMHWQQKNERRLGMPILRGVVSVPLFNLGIIVLTNFCCHCLTSWWLVWTWFLLHTLRYSYPLQSCPASPVGTRTTDWKPLQERIVGSPAEQEENSECSGSDHGHRIRTRQGVVSVIVLLSI